MLRKLIDSCSSCRYLCSIIKTVGKQSMWFFFSLRNESFQIIFKSPWTLRKLLDPCKEICFRNLQNKNENHGQTISDFFSLKNKNSRITSKSPRIIRKLIDPSKIVLYTFRKIPIGGFFKNDSKKIVYHTSVISFQFLVIELQLSVCTRLKLHR